MNNFTTQPSQKNQKNFKINPETPNFLEFTEIFKEIGFGDLINKMGIQLQEISHKKLIATMPVLGNTQPFGLLHGGAHVVLAESLASIGGILWAGLTKNCVGIEINASHHKSTSSGIVTATAQAIKLGKTLACYEIKIVDEQNNLLSTVRVTNLLTIKKTN